HAPPLNPVECAKIGSAYFSVRSAARPTAMPQHLLGHMGTGHGAPRRGEYAEINAHHVQECAIDGTSLMHDPTSGALCSHALHAAPRGRAVPVVLSTLTHRACGGEPFPAETVSPVSDMPCQATARHRCHSRGSGLAVAMVRLATSSDGCATGDVQPVAAPGSGPILALATQARPATDPSGAATAHPADGT